MCSFHEGFLAGFPALRFEVTRTIAEADYVVLNWTFIATHNEPMLMLSGKTIPPTSKKGVLSGSSTFETKESKITRAWVCWGTGSLLGQSGILPPM